MSWGAKLASKVPVNRGNLISQQTRYLVDFIVRELLKAEDDVIKDHIILKLDIHIDKDLIDRVKLAEWQVQEELAIGFKSDAYHASNKTEEVGIFWGNNRENVRDAWLARWSSVHVNEMARSN